MLVLTRKVQQKVQIGDNITITILEVKGRAIRIGIEAPKSVKVLRSELAPTECEVALEESAEVEESPRSIAPPTPCREASGESFSTPRELRRPVATVGLFSRLRRQPQAKAEGVAKAEGGKWKAERAPSAPRFDRQHWGTKAANV